MDCTFLVSTGGLGMLLMLGLGGRSCDLEKVRTSMGTWVLRGDGEMRGYEKGCVNG